MHKKGLPSRALRSPEIRTYWIIHRKTNKSLIMNKTEYIKLLHEEWTQAMKRVEIQCFEDRHKKLRGLSEKQNADLVQAKQDREIGKRSLELLSDEIQSLRDELIAKDKELEEEHEENIRLKDFFDDWKEIGKLVKENQKQESQIKELKNRLPSSMTTALIEKQSKEIKELREGIEKRLIAFSDWTMENEDSPNYVAHQDVKDYLSNF